MVLSILLIAIILLATSIWFARIWQRQALEAFINTLEFAARASEIETHALQDASNLPPPVRRYLSHALGAHRRRLRLAHYTQEGELRSSASSKRWMKFTASQVIAPMRTEFIWNARVVALPLFHLGVRDSLIAGRGAGQVTLLSAIPVGSAGGNMEMHSGALHRFLAEAVWYPTALLPSAKLRWDTIDDRRALATLSDGDIAVSLEFRFNERDEVEGIYTPARWGSFDGGYKQLPWQGSFARYTQREGILVPAQGDVAWFEDGEWRTVWRGTILDATLEFE